MPLDTAPSLWEAIRGWGSLLATVASATFAGLIWWLARKRLSTRYTVKVGGPRPDGLLSMQVSILNRGDSSLVVEAFSVDPPLCLLADDRGAYYGINARDADLPKAKRVNQVSCSLTVEPEATENTSFLLDRAGGFSSCKTVSIRLHILKSFPTIRHKKKQLSAILPAKTRDARS